MKAVKHQIVQNMDRAIVRGQVSPPLFDAVQRQTRELVAQERSYYYASRDRFPNFNFVILSTTSPSQRALIDQLREEGEFQ